MLWGESKKAILPLSMPIAVITQGGAIVKPVI